MLRANIFNDRPPEKDLVKMVGCRAAYSLD